MNPLAGNQEASVQALVRPQHTGGQHQYYEAGHGFIMGPVEQPCKQAGEGQNTHRNSGQENHRITAGPRFLPGSPEVKQDIVVLAEEQKRKAPLTPGRIMAQIAMAPATKIHQSGGTPPPSRGVWMATVTPPIASLLFVWMKDGYGTDRCFHRYLHAWRGRER